LLIKWGRKVARLIIGSRYKLAANGWRYGLVKADHYRPIEEQNFKQPLLTIPLVSVSFLSVGGAKLD
jgi:hypothetical protein